MKSYNQNTSLHKPRGDPLINSIISTIHLLYYNGTTGFGDRPF